MHANELTFDTFRDNIDWCSVASLIPGKDADSCEFKWVSQLKVNLFKNPWMEVEELVLVNEIK